MNITQIMQTTEGFVFVNVFIVTSMYFMKTVYSYMISYFKLVGNYHMEFRKY